MSRRVVMWDQNYSLRILASGNGTGGNEIQGFPITKDTNKINLWAFHLTQLCNICLLSSSVVTIYTTHTDSTCVYRVRIIIPLHVIRRFIFITDCVFSVRWGLLCSIIYMRFSRQRAQEYVVTNVICSRQKEYIKWQTPARHRNPLPWEYQVPSMLVTTSATRGRQGFDSEPPHPQTKTRDATRNIGFLCSMRGFVFISVHGGGGGGVCVGKRGIFGRQVYRLKSCAGTEDCSHSRLRIPEDRTKLVIHQTWTRNACSSLVSLQRYQLTAP
jgi:hypothetical protein